MPIAGIKNEDYESKIEGVLKPQGETTGKKIDSHVLVHHEGKGGRHQKSGAVNHVVTESAHMVGALKNLRAIVS